MTRAGHCKALAVLAMAAWLAGTPFAAAQQGPEGPEPGPVGMNAVDAAVLDALAAPPDAPSPGVTPAAVTPRNPNQGAVTGLPLPRYVSLKTGAGNARRGPGLTHRIDWVFTRAGMPLRITAEYEHWRRVEDSEGAGGWVHYSLLSGVRSVLVARDMAEFLAQPDDAAAVVLKAEAGVIAHVIECGGDWCRLNVDGEKGWVRKSALWGIGPDEEVE
ncbi:SH3 domain-containing protein [Paracoccaceae bacterium Fryx2]|nr:SH3 domain-containing protein [Paracoccaceae bacterium Fryx2]